MDILGNYPAIQTTGLQSSIVESAGGYGETYRLTSPQMTSLWEFILQPGARDTIEQPPTLTTPTTLQTITKGLEAVAQVTGAIKTIAQDIKQQDYAVRNVAVEQASVGPPGDGRVVVNYDLLRKDISQKVDAIGASAESLWGQIKGLFNIAYESPTGGAVGQIPDTIAAPTLSPLLIAIILLGIYLVTR